MAFLDYNGLSRFKSKLDDLFLKKNQGSTNVGKFLKVNADGSVSPDSVPDPTGKADKVSGATNGNFAGLDSNGNLTDSGSKASDFLTSHQDISVKADKVTSATTGDVATLDSNGNLVDSGKTLGTSVPSDAVFTDTTYSAATQSAAGLMSAEDKTKLDGVATGATANIGTITGITMNGASKGTSGTVDLGTVFYDVAPVPQTTPDLLVTSGLVKNATTTGMIDYVARPKYLTFSLTLAAGSWSSATPPTQTLTATGITADGLVEVSLDSSATAEQIDAAATAKLLCTAQAANSITVTCYGTEPTVNVPISVVFWG